MSITIRELTKDDLLLYKEIRLKLLMEEPTSFGSSFEEESAFEDAIWQTRLEKPTVTTLGAFDEEEIIGLCVVVFNPRKKMKHIASIHSMYVKKEYRRKQIAQSLIQRAEKLALKNGIHRLNLSVVTLNEKAKNLYLKLGFEEFGTEPDIICFEDKYYSLLLMSKRIGV